jgi:hypothetical protein
MLVFAVGKGRSRRQNTLIFGPVLNAELTQKPLFLASRKHFLQKDLGKDILNVFHSIFRCYYDYEIL